MSLDSPFWKFIFESLKTDPDTGELLHLAVGGLNEDGLLTSCCDHGILLIVNESLKEIAQQIFTAKGLEKWRAHVASCTLQSLELHRELKRLLPLFAETEIPVVPFKGPVLSEQLYGDPLLRMSVDLDLLVPRDCVVETVDLLMADGYLPEFDCSDLDIWLTPNARYFHCSLLHPSHKWLVEIHWNVFASWRRVSVANSAVREWNEPGERGGLELLLFLCVHGAKHWWIELKWVADVDRCVRAISELDFPELFSRARDRGCLRVVYLALQLAHQTCGLELPDQVVVEIRKDTKVANLARRVSLNWPKPKTHNPSLLWKTRYLLDCRERWTDKVGMIIDYPLLRSLPGFVSKENH